MNLSRFRLWIFTVLLLVIVTTLTNLYMLRVEIKEGSLHNLIQEELQGINKVYGMMINERVLRGSTTLERFKTVDMYGTNTSSMDHIRLVCVTPDAYDLLILRYPQLPEHCEYLGVEVIHEK